MHVTLLFVQEAVTVQSGSMGDTSQQLQDIQSLVSQLSMCWQQLQVQVEDKQVRASPDR